MTFRKRVGLGLASGWLLSLAHPAPGAWILAWVGLGPLFWAIEGASAPAALLLGYLAGLVFFGLSLSWMTRLFVPGWIALGVYLYLACYFAVFALLVNRFFARKALAMTGGGSSSVRWLALVFVPALWVCLEWVRTSAFTGFGWVLLGYSQYQVLPVIQIADIFGVWGVSFLLAFANIAVYERIKMGSDPFSKGSDPKRAIDFILLGTLVVVSVYGLFRLATPLPKGSEKPLQLKVAVVQANISQKEARDPASKRKIFDRYLELTRRAADEKPELIVWPELALPGIFAKEKELQREFYPFVRSVNTWLLSGATAPADWQDKNFFNCAFLFDSNGSLRGRYDKLEPVPFAERFVKGKEPSLVAGPGKIRYVVLIGGEDASPGLVNQFVDREPDFLVNLTNDVRLKGRRRSRQHLQPAVFRAVENRLPVVRAANHGLSGFIDAWGRVAAVRRGNSRLTSVVQIVRGEGGLYRRFGADWFLALCFFLALFLFPFSRKP